VGLRQLGWAEDDEQADARQVPEVLHALAARLLIILAGWESKQGRTEYGLRLLDRAERLVAADEQGILLADNPAESENLAAVLLNRSIAHLNAADVRRARADLIWCRRIATDNRYDLIVPKALHNLGYCDLLAGDIPAALQLFNAAANAYRLSAPGNLPVLAMDKARAAGGRPRQ
jgi:hypothetical protein